MIVKCEELVSNFMKLIKKFKKLRIKMKKLVIMIKYYNNYLWKNLIKCLKNNIQKNN